MPRDLHCVDVHRVDGALERRTISLSGRSSQRRTMDGSRRCRCSPRAHRRRDRLGVVACRPILALRLLFFFSLRGGELYFRFFCRSLSSLFSADGCLFSRESICHDFVRCVSFAFRRPPFLRGFREEPVPGRLRCCLESRIRRRGAAALVRLFSRATPCLAGVLQGVQKRPDAACTYRSPHAPQLVGST